jgi:hypothetical protein
VNLFFCIYALSAIMDFKTRAKLGIFSKIAVKQGDPERPRQQIKYNGLCDSPYLPELTQVKFVIRNIINNLIDNQIAHAGTSFDFFANSRG